MERFWNTVRMPKAVPHRRLDSVSCTVRGTDGQMTAATMLCVCVCVCVLNEARDG